VESWSQTLEHCVGFDGPVRVEIRCTDKSNGDLAIDFDASRLDENRRQIINRRWIWLRQVHGNRVVVVPESAGADDLDAILGTEADALVTRRADVALAVQSADCATIALWSDDGVIGAIHAGWRGLEADVIGATVDAMRSLGAETIHARTGPCIGVECYEFGATELERMVAVFGPEVVGRSAEGNDALDVRRAVSLSLERSGVHPAGGSLRCSACRPEELWSHRSRNDKQRQALVVWIGNNE
jgi:YfiH family protein